MTQSKFEQELEAAKDCIPCNSETLPQLKICDVCRFNDNDLSEKLCKFCSICNAWICEEDETNWLRRGNAAFRKLRDLTQ